jgi:hypothetical protein
VDTCVGLVVDRLAVVGEVEAVVELPTHAVPAETTANDIHDPDLIDAVWANQVDPFVATLFNAPTTSGGQHCIQNISGSERGSQARKSLAKTTREVVHHLVADGILDENSNEPLAVIACRFCLDAGADHVLVGMRSPEYVAQLEPLFSRTPTRSSQTAAQR